MDRVESGGVVMLFCLQLLVVQVLRRQEPQPYFRTGANGGSADWLAPQQADLQSRFSTRFSALNLTRVDVIRSKGCRLRVQNVVVRRDRLNYETAHYMSGIERRSS